MSLGLELFEKVANHFRYKGQKNNKENERSVNLTILFSFTTMGMCLLSFVVQKLALGSEANQTIYLLPLVAVSSFLSLYFIRFKNSFLLPLYLQFTVDFLVIIKRVMTSGGMYSPALFWFAPLTVAIVMLVPIRHALAWIFLILLSIFVFCYPEIFNLNYTGMVTNKVVYFVILVVPVLIISFFIILFEKERRENEKRILKAEHDVELSKKVIALSAVSSNFAHEVNNPLAIIKGNVDLVRRELSSKSLMTNNLAESFDDISANMNRIEGIVNSLRTFTNDDFYYNAQKIDLKEFVQESTEKFKEKLKRMGIDLRYRNIEENFVIKGQLELLEKVMENLLINSIDAIKDQSFPWIEIQFVDDSQNNAYKILITDSGKGIDSDLAKEIMQPFFSTKEISTGRVGLGLALCKNIMKSHHGDIELNKLNSNTQFVLTLPIHKD